MKKIFYSKFLVLVITTIVTMFIQTIAYSALSTTIKVLGNAHARLETNVRITKFNLYETSTNAISSYEEYSTNTITSNMYLPAEDSYVIYEIEVTNYSTQTAGIKSISGLPSNLSYELIDYTLKDKICNNNNCTTLANKTFYLKITGSGQYDVTLTFDFENIYSVTYKNLSSSEYPTEIISGDTLTLDVSNSIMNKFYAENSEGTLMTSLSSNVLTINNITSDITIIGEQENIFDYVGNYQIFTVPTTGIYKIELWGAGGNTCAGTSGKGGYTKGEIILQEGLEIYVYVGGQGQKIETIGSTEGTEGYNGGGRADNSGAISLVARCGGHGATDIRLISGNWDNFESLKSRIMVAGGGGSYSQETGGSSGGLQGYEGGVRTSTDGTIISASGTGGTQTSGGQSVYVETYKGSGENGSFGKGGAGLSYASGGGGGYYGGAGGTRNTIDGGGGGGSSFISGHNGCVAITEDSTEELINPVIDSTGTTCTDGTTDIICSYHYSGYVFQDTIIIDGNGYNWTTKIGTEVVKMPSFDGTSTMTGNSTNGYAKITLIELKEE